jgi:hypothetical protein
MTGQNCNHCNHCLLQTSRARAHIDGVNVQRLQPLHIDRREAGEFVEVTTRTKINSCLQTYERKQDRG